MRGAGEIDSLWLEGMRERGLWRDDIGGFGVTAEFKTGRPSELMGDLLVSPGDLSPRGVLSVDASLFVPGDFARFADSMNQCLIEASWLMIGCW